MKILMVCLGNICRSPLAEGIMQHKLQERQLDWTVDSAGTGGWHEGELPDTRSIRVAKKYGIDISGQRARKFSMDDFHAFDLIYAMDRNNFHDLLALAPDQPSKDKVRLLLEEAHGMPKEVPDPYYNDHAFEPVFHLLNEACERIVARIASVPV